VPGAGALPAAVVTTPPSPHHATPSPTTPSPALSHRTLPSRAAGSCRPTRLGVLMLHSWAAGASALMSGRWSGEGVGTLCGSASSIGGVHVHQGPRTAAAQRTTHTHARTHARTHTNVTPPDTHQRHTTRHHPTTRVMDDEELAYVITRAREVRAALLHPICGRRPTSGCVGRASAHHSTAHHSTASASQPHACWAAPALAWLLSAVVPQLTTEVAAARQAAALTAPARVATRAAGRHPMARDTPNPHHILLRALCGTTSPQHGIWLATTTPASTHTVC
jgi:hypothetical protein